MTLFALDIKFCCFMSPTVTSSGARRRSWREQCFESSLSGKKVLKYAHSSLMAGVPEDRWSVGCSRPSGSWGPGSSGINLGYHHVSSSAPGRGGQCTGRNSNYPCTPYRPKTMIMNTIKNAKLNLTNSPHGQASGATWHPSPVCCGRTPNRTHCLS